ncbi:MAG: M48 family metalloprotease [Gammaproteobacteria bacterium]|nr:M48 family metalloprotease [Gammaproteobacteria bacterium]
MDFFGHQDNARRQSALLLVAFIVAMFGMATLIQVFIGSIMMFFGSADSLYELSLPAKCLIGLFWAAIVIGCLFRYFDVRGGGAVLAKRFGAEPVGSGQDKRQDQRLRNVVAEMCVASRCRRPDIYVLRNEASLNAFVVGGFKDNPAMVVTQGLLDELDRDELQAVVAHEYAHVANGDVPLNMKLFIVMGGLLAVDEIGSLLMHEVWDRNAPLHHPGILVGAVFKVVGFVGVVSATLIRSGFSRQREYLADATAVQYTRNPQALASALSAIRDADIDKPLQGHYAAEIAHLCFQGGDLSAWWKKLTASHPPIQKRIKIICPTGMQKRRQKKESRSEFQAKSLNTANEVTSLFGGSAFFADSGADTNTEVDSETEFTNEASDSADNNAIIVGDGVVISHDDDVFLEPLTDRASMMMQDASSCLAVLFAVFAVDESIDRRSYLSAVSFAYNQNFTDQVKHILEVLEADLRSQPNTIIEHATSRLSGSVQEENRRRFLKNLERLLIAEKQYNLTTYVTVQLLRHKLNADFPILTKKAEDANTPAEGVAAKTFDQMGEEFALLLSLVIEGSGAPEAEIDADYRRVLRAYTIENIPRSKSSDAGVIEKLEGAFQTLLVQPRPIRQAFVEHCREIVMQDNHVTKAEIALLKIFSASLGCDVAISRGNSDETSAQAA